MWWHSKIYVHNGLLHKLKKQSIHDREGDFTRFLVHSSVVSVDSRKESVAQLKTTQLDKSKNKTKYKTEAEDFVCKTTLQQKK